MSSAEKKTVLICDDEPNIRESIHYVVVKAGFEPILAIDGVEAYNKARDLNPDLLLLDVGMPGMTGFDICERLRADAVFNAMKIVILTSYGQLSDQCRAAEVGADRFIVKPFSPRHLKQLLCEMLG